MSGWESQYRLSKRECSSYADVRGANLWNIISTKIVTVTLHYYYIFLKSKSIMGTMKAIVHQTHIYIKLNVF